MTNCLTILVLGVGGNVSQGIVKALRLSSLRPRIIGACISAEAYGLYACDVGMLSPLAADASFIPWVLNVCNEYQVAAILSGVESVLDKLAIHQVEIESTGAIVVVSGVDALQVSNDKLRTAQWLESRGCNFARSAPAEDSEAVKRLTDNCGFPLIAKPRTGKAAIGVRIARCPSDLTGLPAGYVVQEYLGSEAEEYTAASFVDSSREVRGTIVLRRQLIQGTTCFAEAGNFPNVAEEAAKIARFLPAVGPCNVQLRMHRGLPVCFEINARFSGTTAIRAELGFNDVDAAIRHFVLGEQSIELVGARDVVAIRYWNELYVPRSVFDEMRKNGKLTLDNSGK